MTEPRILGGRSAKTRRSARLRRAVGATLPLAVLSACSSGGLVLGRVDRPVVEVVTTQHDESTRGMVVTAHPEATRVGVEMLSRGGNAADAAVAAAFALAVVEPSMNGIGGRNQILVYLPDGSIVGIDATTQVPAAYDPQTAERAFFGYATIGVPGAIAGLARLAETQGTMPLAALIEPAIVLARSGFVLLPGEAARHQEGADQLDDFPGSRAAFLKPDGSPYRAGEIFRQPQLARTLATIARHGPDAFYEGRIAHRLAADVLSHGGYVSEEALASYEAVEARVVRGSYRGLELVGLGPPAGGVITIEALQILENFDLAALPSAAWAAVIADALRLAIEDLRSLRLRRLSLDRLLDKDWAAARARHIEVPAAATAASAGRQPVEPPLAVSRVASSTPSRGPTQDQHDGHTTHLSVADADGRAVALTQTLGLSLGSRVASPGLGFLYATTMGGYLGELAPGERAASAISPLLVRQDGRLSLVLGSAGGIRIPSSVVQTVCRLVDQNLDLDAALAAPRVHPVDGGLEMETTPGEGWQAGDVALLRSLGLEVKEVERRGAFGRVHAVRYHPDRGLWEGAADPDWEGTADGPDG